MVEIERKKITYLETCNLLAPVELLVDATSVFLNA